MVGLGQVHANVYEDLINIFRIAPIVIPLDFVWIYGYTIRNLLNSIIKRTYPVVQTEKTTKLKFSSYRRWLFYIYSLIFILEVVQGLLIVQESKASPEPSWQLWIDFAINLVYNMTLPIYMMLCWSILFEFKMLAKYIKSLMKIGCRPDFAHLHEVKRSYKLISNHIMLINDTCNIYFSWVILILYLANYNELSTMLRSTINLLATGPLNPIHVRMFIGNFFSVLLQMLLLFFTIYFAILANDQARYVHVRLNDLTSEANVVFTPELYKAVSSFQYLNAWLS